MAGQRAVHRAPPPRRRRHGGGLRGVRPRARPAGRRQDAATTSTPRPSTASSKSSGPSRTWCTPTWCDCTSSCSPKASRRSSRWSSWTGPTSAPTCGARVRGCRPARRPRRTSCAARIEEPTLAGRRAGCGAARRARDARARRIARRLRSAASCLEAARGRASAPCTARESCIATSSRPTCSSRPEGRVVVLDFGVSTELRARDRREPRRVGRVRRHGRATCRRSRPCPRSSRPPRTGTASASSSTRPSSAACRSSAAAMNVLTMKTVGDPVPPAERVRGVPADLESLCRDLLSRDAAKRPGAAEILRRLGQGPRHRPAASLPPMREPRPRRGSSAAKRQLRALREASTRSSPDGASRCASPGRRAWASRRSQRTFLDELVERGEAVVLRGRAYERESVPYKAVDSLIDALTRYLSHLDEEGEAVDCARARRVARAHLPRPAPGAELCRASRTSRPPIRRRRAAGRPSPRCAPCSGPWRSAGRWCSSSTTSSGATPTARRCSLEVLRPPDAPPILLRHDAPGRRVDEAAVPQAELRSRWPDSAEAHDITVGPLDAEEARAPRPRVLAELRAAGRAHERAPRRASPREARFSSRSWCAATSRRDPKGTTLAVLTLDEIVAQRGRAPPARRAAASSRSSRSAAGPCRSRSSRAAATGERPTTPSACCGRARLLRSGLRGRQGRRGTEPRPLPRDHRGADPAARSFATSTGASPRRSRRPRAPTPKPSRRIGSAPANPRAPSPFWSAPPSTRSTSSPSSTAARLFAHGHPDGRGVARRDAPPAGPPAPRCSSGPAVASRPRAPTWRPPRAPPRSSARELERAAAVELFASGRLVEGEAVLHRVLEAVGLRAPRSTARRGVLAARGTAFASRSWRTCFGMRFEERLRRTSPGLTHARIDAVFAAAMGFAFSNVILGTCMGARNLLMALGPATGFNSSARPRRVDPARARWAASRAAWSAGSSRSPGRLSRAPHRAEGAERGRPGAWRSSLRGQRGRGRVPARRMAKRARPARRVDGRHGQHHDHSAGWRTRRRRVRELVAELPRRAPRARATPRASTSATPRPAATGTRRRSCATARSRSCGSPRTTPRAPAAT